ncbi:hypothetical protein MSHO_27310 [Mycobacterium shottsii]|uniref:Uncharacterized protein n=1 Tax=Mycobacterium shottsii TaxID=133549 RepID=A0A7I7LBF7_9MYCO|nr:hypothetical protein MSHO_27310 [Mycobacterium shottsii]
MSAFGAPTYALANFAVISARDDIDSPLPMPAKDRPFRGHFYVMHRGRFTGISRDACRTVDKSVDNEYYLTYLTTTAGATSRTSTVLVVVTRL